MQHTIENHPIAFRIMALIAIIFGLVTIRAGGMVLFTESEAQHAAGGAYELRTIGAMSLRSIVWIGIALITFSIGRLQVIECDLLD